MRILVPKLMSHHRAYFYYQLKTNSIQSVPGVRLATAFCRYSVSGLPSWSPIEDAAARGCCRPVAGARTSSSAVQMDADHFAASRGLRRATDARRRARSRAKSTRSADRRISVWTVEVVRFVGGTVREWPSGVTDDGVRHVSHRISLRGLRCAIT